MIKTYDWIAYAQSHQDLKEKIEEAITSGKDCELTILNTYKIIFEADTLSAIVEPLSQSKALQNKIIPKRISYKAIQKLLNGEYEDITEEDFKDIYNDHKGFL